jgi:hypothetical protein
VQGSAVDISEKVDRRICQNLIIAKIESRKLFSIPAILALPAIVAISYENPHQHRQ